jgi:hypothetical protein
MFEEITGRVARDRTTGLLRAKWGWESGNWIQVAQDTGLCEPFGSLVSVTLCNILVSNVITILSNSF